MGELAGGVHLTREVPSAPEWAVRYTVTERDGIPIISEIRVAPTAEMMAASTQPLPQRGVTASLLRQIPVDRQIIPLATAVATGVDGQSLLAKGAHSHRRGVRHDDYFLAIIASLYLQLVASPSQNIYRDMQQTLSDKRIFYSIEGIKELVRKARMRELLTGTARGRAGGRLTPRATKLLKSPKGAQRG